MPMPLFPYPGIRAFFIVLVARPFVLALKDLAKLGFLIPNFILFIIPFKIIVKE